MMDRGVSLETRRSNARRGGGGRSSSQEGILPPCLITTLVFLLRLPLVLMNIYKDRFAKEHMRS